LWSVFPKDKDFHGGTRGARVRERIQNFSISTENTEYIKFGDGTYTPSPAVRGRVGVGANGRVGLRKKLEA